MKKILIWLTAFVLLLSSCKAPDEPCIGCQDIVDADNQFSTVSIDFGEGSAEYILLRSNYWFGSVPSGTVTTIKSVAELESFQKKHEVYSGGQQMLSIENFNGYAKKLDEKFFDEKILLAIHIQSGSGSDSFYVSDISTEGSCLTVGVSSLLHPPMTAFTTDMASWHMVVEIDRNLIGSVTEFKAVNNTKHRTYEGDSSDVNMKPVIFLDENSMIYYLSYGDYLQNNHRNKYELSETELTLLVTEDKSKKLVFDISDKGFVFNEEKSEWDANYIVPLTFPDGTVFK